VEGFVKIPNKRKASTQDNNTRGETIKMDGYNFHIIYLEDHKETHIEGGLREKEK
jgi:hypothetical protein